jgi:chromosome segregation ATPase
MVDPNPHSYENAVTTLPRTKLEEFALQAVQTMEDLERENKQLERDIEDVQKIDIDVIKGWREWIQTVNKDHEKWIDIATTLSTEKQEIKEKYRAATETIENIMESLGKIETIALAHSGEGTKTLQLRTGYKKLLKIIEEIVDKHSATEEESKAGAPADDDES